MSDTNQSESGLPLSNNESRKSKDLLPRYYRTDNNQKFLSVTVDQLIQPGAIKKLSGYIGRQNAKSVTGTDIFLEASDTDRQNYQLEPAAIIQDFFGNVTFYKDYIDHINHVSLFGGDVKNHERLNQQEFYSWDPHIDWDKFVNFQQYYWLPYGPDPIPVAGQQLAIISTYTVVAVDEDDNYAYVFTPDGLSKNPTIRLYRGQTYKFEINTPNNPFSIKTSRIAGTLNRYNVGVSEAAVENGTITFTVQDDTPDILFYVSEADANTGGIFQILDITENTALNVDTDILGKKTYTMSNGVALSNGMKLRFIGQVTPEQYSNSNWYVEGVGSAIKLIAENNLEIVSPDDAGNNLPFDDEAFDTQAFSTAVGVPLEKDYLVINRASPDRNPWSRTNRWFHKDIIYATASALGKTVEIDESQRATRPIIEFMAGIKLLNFGHEAKINVDLIDTFTTDVFSTIEGSLGVKIDEIDVIDGMRILFTADPDILVKDKIFKVNFIDVTIPGKIVDFSAALDPSVPDSSSSGISSTMDIITCLTDHGFVNGQAVTYLNNGNVSIAGLTHRNVYYVKVIDSRQIKLFSNPKLSLQVNIMGVASGTHSLEVFSGMRTQINLVEDTDSVPLLNETVLVKRGAKNQGKMFWYTGDSWKEAQAKTGANQAPLFDVFDSQGNSYGDLTVYDGSSFARDGTKIFSYKQGTGKVDSELGFPLSYQNINNVGDIVFTFDLLNDTFTYKDAATILTKRTDIGFVKVISTRENFKYQNGWLTSLVANAQPVIRIYKNSGLINNFPIDVYDNKDSLDDLQVRVYVNSKRLYDSEFDIVDGPIRKHVALRKDAALTDVITLKCFSKQPKNNNGYYEIPVNLQNNPKNENITQFTLGEVVDHVDSIVDNITGFAGIYPGSSNIRDLGNITPYGTKFVQHSGPLNLSLYHLGSKLGNAFKAIEKSRLDYGVFKREFISIATNSGIDTDPRRHVDHILTQLTKDKTKLQPYYLSDMFAFTSATRLEYDVLDSRTKKYPLTVEFNLNVLSNKSVLIYLNGNQLLHGRDYVFGDNNFFEILTEINEGDIIEAFQFDSTDGSFCPPTPTKLGLYPLFEPKKFLDTTYLEPTEVIQGHDGSIVVAFGDYRDDLLLELESRIFNNIKVRYDSKIFDIYDYIPGYSRDTAYSKQESDSILSQFFFQWASGLDRDFTDQSNDLWDRFNPFTFNFQGNYTPNGVEVPAFWRGIYSWMLDTDRPHTHPWECLGFSIMPVWWEAVYGPAPYTSNNLILWEDIRKGIIREPGVPIRINKKFAKSILAEGIELNEANELVEPASGLKPVDADGALLDPLNAGFVNGFIKETAAGYYVFGDGATVESAWRRSSYYPFAVIQAALLMQPNKVLGTCLDRSRIVRNINDQFVYLDTGLRLQLKDIAIPSTGSSSTRVMAAGIINYVVEYLYGNSIKGVEQYQSELKKLVNKLGSKLGGFTDKAKFRMMLDSKSPTASSGVFIPEENYQIALNTSSPIKRLSYSGIIITKYSDGYEVRGYDVDHPYFTYYQFIGLGRPINVGGISESYIRWEANQFYLAGKIVRANNQYYRVKSNHTSGDTFDSSLYAKLPQLPITGGRDAILRNQWNLNAEFTVAYGTKFSTIQDLVDFIQGYGVYLENQGFIFDDFNFNLKAVSNWETAVKEFLFWTTQNWNTGAVLSISPAANKLVVRSDFSVVDNIRDQFFGYKIYRVDGLKLSTDLINLYRENNEFAITSTNTAHGIYGAVLHLVQKEHVALLDNKTIFNDVIYDVAPGYRQEKIKVLGYISAKWTGGFNVPGFLFDQAKIQEWIQWQDYYLGDIVKYKEFYYSAEKFIPGTAEFEDESWIKLDNKAEPKLLPNWDYRAEQFTDYYDLESDNFDKNQQKIAQHLIGYQKRQYLENIIKDDISQYKFYQGMIIEKGTQNVLSKLFDVLSSINEESLIFNEEWAVRVGNYGATEIYDEVEFKLDESNFKLNPQPFELLPYVLERPVDFVYRQAASDVYIKPSNYDSNPWKLKTKSAFLRSPGYVRYEDIVLNIDSIDEILTKDITTFAEGDYIWCAFEGRSWNVYRFTKNSFAIEDLDYSDGTLKLTCNKIPNVVAGSTIGIHVSSTTPSTVNGFYKITSVVNRDIIIKTTLNNYQGPFDDSSEILTYKLPSCRVANADDINSLLTHSLKPNELVWADNNGKNLYTVYANNSVFKTAQLSNTYDNSIDNLHFGKKITVSKNGKAAAVASDKSVLVYIKDWDKDLEQYRWINRVRLETISNNTITDSTIEQSQFGKEMCFSPDGFWLAVAAPYADNIKTAYRGEFVPSPGGFYSAGDIVKIKNTLWRAKRDYNDDGSTITNATQDWEQVFLINTDSSRTGSGFTNQGYVQLFYKTSTEDGIDYKTSNSYRFVSPDPTNNEKFGSKMTMARDGDDYVLAVSSIGYNNDQGRVYTFRGFSVFMFDSTQIYNRGDVAFYDDALYGKGYTSGFYEYLLESDGKTAVGVFALEQWKLVSSEDYREYFWKIDYDSSFVGMYDSNLSYDPGQIVFYNYEFYKCLASTVPGAFVISKWELITGNLNVTGYFPHETNINGVNLTVPAANSEFVEPVLEGDNFGYDIAFTDNAATLVISAPVADQVTPENYKGLFDATQVYDKGDVVYYNGYYSYLLDSDGSTPVGIFVLSNWQLVPSTNANVPSAQRSVYTGKVFVYKNNNSRYNLAQTIGNPYDDSTEKLDRFGESVSITPDGNYLAVGGNLADVVTLDAGRVSIFKRTNDQFSLNDFQTLTSNNKEINERFGSKLSFMTNDTLAVFALNGDSSLKTYFDAGATTFDNETSNIIDYKTDTGRVDIYNRLNTYFIYGESLPVDISILSTDRYGSTIGMSNNDVLVGVPYDNNDSVQEAGSVSAYSRKPNANSWLPYRVEVPRPDAQQIKKAYLYDRIKNKLVMYLDVVDPIQGKIPEPASNEIRYKTYYDPAIYSVGTSNLNVDAGISWTKTHVGELWWDLTRARFIENQGGDVVYRSTSWNRLYETASIDIYEWVETKLLPEAWDALSGTPEGDIQGISGKSRYGNTVYSVKKRYDTLTKKFYNTYYYWVKNPNIIPNNFGRKLSAEAVSKLIADPMSQGYSCLALTDSNTFSLVNVTNLIAANYHNLNIQYWTVDLGYTENNAHSQWKIISENENTTIPKNIETKWIDSLVGKDANGKSVPDVNLPVKLRYGIDFKFRQSMFANRIEAVKQYFERVNSVLKNKLIVDSYDLSKLDLYEEPPTAKAGEWDFAIDTFNEFKFLKVSNLQQAIVEPIVSPDGYITGIKAIHPGKGYVNAPYIKISGQGRNAVVRSAGINSTDGSLQLDPNDPTKLNIEIINRGEGYLQNNTTATVRTHKILVRSDAESFNKWAIYERIFNITSNKWEWVRTKTQSYDVRQYWTYIDWYDTGYSEFTKFDFVVENTYELSLIEDDIGDIIKVNNVGSGGWMLLEKYDNIDTIDYTKNYKVVGRGNGTIQFLGSLYDYKKYNVGYDGPLYDSVGYDNLADRELVIILSFVKEDLFVDDLRIEYLKLFFSSLRYVLHEQIFVDWVFKTSFVKAIHNVGELKEKVTYNSDNLSDFESYISEVKPYRTQIREFVSLYNRTEPAGMSTTDFDLLPVVNNKVKTDTLRVFIDEVSGNIVNDVNSWTRISSETILQVGKQYLANTSSGAFAVYLPDNPAHNDVISITDGSNWAANNLTIISSNKTINGLTKNFIVDAADTTLYITYNEDIENWNITIGSNSSTLANYPWKYWLSNVGFSVQSIEILDGGSGYLADPKVTIVGGFGNGATARAVKVNGQIIRIDIISSGGGYLKAPIVEINGNLSESGRPARAIAIIESEVVRSNKIAIKFDRVTKNYFVSELTSTETFVGTGSKIQFSLRFSPQITKKSTSNNQLLSIVTVNGKELLSGEYSLVSKKSTSRRYTSYSGLLIFKEPPANNDQIEITYHKDFNHLTAADRINFYYNSTTGRLGKDLAQLMTGIDYGGVIVTGLDLSPQQGWDILPWSKDDWDKFDESFDDYAVISDGTSITFTLPFIPSIGEEINVYVEGVRVDDPYFDLYDGSTVQPNGLINPPANAVLNTIIGDGSTLTFTLPSLITSSGDVIVFRRSTSDGSVNIDSYDTLLNGGDMAYSTATGINPDEIIVDGDKFVTPMTSHAPEEVVPGQLADAVAIKVYQLPSSGSSKISFKNYVCDGSTTTFVVNQLPSNPTAIFVKLNNVILERDVDFTFNWETSLLELIAASSAGDNLSIITFGVASQNLLDTNYFVADGSTFEYITNAPWTSNLGSVVLVNGEAPPAYELFRTNEGYVSPGLVGIRFVPQNTPDVNAVISYMITSDQNQSSSIIKSEVITPDGSSTIYTLENTIGNARPNETNILTIVNGKILRPANVEYFTLDSDQLIYPLSVYKSYPYLIDPANYKVYLDGVELSQGAEYIIDVYNSSFGDVGAATIELNNQLYKDGAVLSVANFVNAEYLLLQSGNNFSIEFATVPAISDKIEVISFYNHDVQEIIRTAESIELQGIFTPLSYSYETYQNLVDNSITLFRTVISHDYVWVIKNNNLLTPNIDYVLELDRRTIVLTDPLVTTDILDVIRFNDRTVRGSYGYMQFKDMLNRDHYKRLSKNKTTELTKNLLPTDTEIHVKNAAVLGNANPSQNIPGVLEINGERVEYFVKTGNVLSQLRRGTLGTGIPALHRAGQYVIDIGVSETIPYKDEYIIDKSMSDSSTQNVDLSYIPSATTTGWSVNGGYKQCNEIEVFVGGYRLKKTPFSVFEESNGYPYSPEGDTAYPAQFSVNGVNQSVRLTDIPPENTKIVVIKKTGYVWNDLNTSFDQSDNVISNFIRANETVFPQYLADKYQYILETDDYYPVNTDDNDIVELD